MMPEVRGDGWRLYEHDRFAILKFNHCPDGGTLAKLRRSRFDWSYSRRAWYAAMSHEAWLEAQTIARLAETWESVGESPPSVWDGMDDPGFFGSD